MNTQSQPSSDTQSESTGPLAGIRVLDFTAIMAGPYATRYLADMGADVIKVEPAEGDFVRSREPLRNGSSTYFGHLNAGKRSICLDLKDPESVAAIKTIVAQMDVVVENFRPGAMARLGLDYATLSKINPKLIYCSISGFGQTGPDAERPAYAQIVQASSGYENAFATYQVPLGTKADWPARPANAGLFIADVLGAIYAYSGILAAICQRNRTGRGLHVDSTLIEGMLNLTPYEVQEAQQAPRPQRPVYPPFQTKDGWIMIAAVNPRNFETLFDTIGVEGWRDDPTLATNAGREKNWPAAMARIEVWTSQKTRVECEAALAPVGVPVTSYRSVREALDDEQLRHRGTLAPVSDAAGEFRVPNLPYRFSDGRVQVGGRVPGLGEHSEEVLSQLAGLKGEALQAVVARGRKRG